MQAQVRIVVFAFVFIFVYSLGYSIFVWLKSRPIKPQPLPLRVVKWTSAIEVDEVYSVDLDGDGCAELFTRDSQNRIWWAKWTGKQPSFESMPIPSGSWVSLPYWPEPPAQLLAIMENNRLWLVARFGNTWEKVHIPVMPVKITHPMLGKPQVSMPGMAPHSILINAMVRLLDLDGDGKANDVLILKEPRRVEWWRREGDGKIKLRDSLYLPKPYVYLNLEDGTTWKQCELQRTYSLEHGFISVENGKLRWKGSFAERIRWMNADIDGDGKKDHIEQWVWRNGRRELFIQFTEGGLKVLALPPECSVFVDDFDADGKSEILVREPSSTSYRVKLTLWQYDRGRDVWIHRSKDFVPAGHRIILPNAPFLEGSLTTDKKGSLTIDKTESGECFLLASVKQGDHARMERWSWVGKDWQSQLIATLPELESEEDFLFVIWTGNGLIVVEERGLPPETVSFRRSVREALELIGFKSLSKRPIPFPPSRIWGWDLQRHRWLLLGYALADNKSGGHWMDIPLSNKGELGIIWLSLNSINVGRFKKGIWQAGRLIEPLDYQKVRTTVLWDGRRYWTVLYDGKNFVAFTVD